MVLDHELRILLWSRGMVEASSGLDPEIGTSVLALPFPSRDHRARVVASLEFVMGEDAAEAIRHPDRALQAVTHAKPNVILHLKPSFHLGPSAAADVVFCMSAAKIAAPASEWSRSGGAPPPSGARCHVLAMGKDSQFDPSLSSLLQGAGNAASDVGSDLTSESDFMSEFTTETGQGSDVALRL